MPETQEENSQPKNQSSRENVDPIWQKTPRAYKIADGLTEAVTYFMVIFAPWAFGTTDNWSEWILASAGYTLGLLLLGKWIVRKKTNYTPLRATLTERTT